MSNPGRAERLMESAGGSCVGTVFGTVIGMVLVTVGAALLSRVSGGTYLFWLVRVIISLAGVVLLIGLASRVTRWACRNVLDGPYLLATTGVWQQTNGTYSAQAWDAGGHEWDFADAVLRLRGASVRRVEVECLCPNMADYDEWVVSIALMGDSGREAVRFESKNEAYGKGGFRGRLILQPDGKPHVEEYLSGSLSDIWHTLTLSVRPSEIQCRFETKGDQGLRALEAPGDVRGCRGVKLAVENKAWPQRAHGYFRNLRIWIEPD